MLVFRNKVDIEINYPIENFSKKEKIIYFDIETTGFSRKYCIVYLIGCMYYSGDELCYTQWLAENFNDEANVLMAFNKFIKDFDTVIHFNGNSFDIPFVTERGKKYNLEFDFDNYQSIDIYKPVSKLNHILKMENNKQKSFEKLLGINRSDPFSGGDLIEVFKHYVESKDERLLFPLLLHNKEDVWKYFFKNYKDYYFLPLEDRAIHKSIGEFMDKKFRKAATASTCYEKFSGSFLPIFDSKSKNFENCFKLEYKDKNQYIKADSINDNTITEYSHIILDYLKNNK